MPDPNQIYDPNGKPIVPASGPARASVIRDYYMLARVLPQDAVPRERMESLYREDMIRAQVPWLVSIYQYDSKFQMNGTKREFFVYAPPVLSKGAFMAHRLWKKWTKPTVDGVVMENEEGYPKVDDLMVAEPIDDALFDDAWKHTHGRSHRAAGHPEDPFAFTCLDGDVKIYTQTDPTSALEFQLPTN